jgi:hypothetical protein
VGRSKTIPLCSSGGYVGRPWRTTSHYRNNAERIERMNTRTISRSITFGAAAVLIVLVGALLLTGCASSGDSGSAGSSSNPPSHQHHH